MLRLLSGRRLLVLALMAIVAVAFATTPGFAQTGAVKGKIVDQKGKPVPGALVLIENADGTNFKIDTKGNNKGEYIQIGLRPGNYKVTASTKDLGAQAFSVRVRLGDPAEVNFVLGGGAAASAAAAEELKKNDALKKLFDEGVAASTAGDFDTAAAKFTEAATMVPKCFDCYYNLGFAKMQKKEYDKAEEAYNKAIELKPAYVEAYNGLATVYNAQKKFDKASEASQKASELAAAAGPAGGSGGVDAEYNNGVIDFNAQKFPEAVEHLSAVIKLNEKHAQAHYLLGMAYINQGKFAEAVAMLEKFLVLAPDDKKADEVRKQVPALKGLIK